MKLNYKRTLLVGFAFFLISVFWQAYDSTIPMILTNKFGMSQFWSGVIMAIDNVLALFMLPLFGALSDKTNTRYGKRTPFIIVGTVVACIAFVALSFVDNVQYRKIEAVSKIDDPASLQQIYAQQADARLIDAEGNEFVLSEKFTQEEFTAITCKIEKDGERITNPDYIDYVTPARHACVADITGSDPSSLILFIALLLVVLISMATFRSPAVALMPDVTMKPLRSKANAIINLMGTAGGILVLVLGMIFATSAVENAYMRYNAFYATVAGVMLLALGIFLKFVHERQWAAEMQADSRRYGIEGEAEADTSEKKSLSSAQKRSLLFLLASIVLWFFGYNAVTSKYSVYAQNILNKDYNTTLLIAQAGAIVAYLPVGIIASKIGRKKTILAGVAMLTTAFFAASFVRSNSSTMLMNGLFLLAGVAWATINVNSFPMVVEMCSGSDTGKYTGFYYTASMAAQTATPMISGWFMDRMGMTVLFPYAAIFAGAAFVTMLFVKHGDSKAAPKKGLDAFDTEE